MAKPRKTKTTTSVPAESKTPPPVVLANVDPAQINSRLQRQVGVLLTQLEEGEHITLKERIAALIAIGRIQVMFVGLRKETAKDDNAGSTVKRYAAAFAHDPRRGAAIPGPAPERPARDDGSEWWDDAETDDDGDDAA